MPNRAWKRPRLNATIQLARRLFDQATELDGAIPVKNWSTALINLSTEMITMRCRGQNIAHTICLYMNGSYKLFTLWSPLDDFNGKRCFHIMSIEQSIQLSQMCITWPYEGVWIQKRSASATTNLRFTQLPFFFLLTSHNNRERRNESSFKCFNWK